MKQTSFKIMLVGEENILRYALQIRSLKTTGRFISIYGKIGLKICNYLTTQFQIGMLYNSLAESHPNTEVRIKKQVSEFLGFQNFDKLKVDNKITEWLQKNRGLISDKEAFICGIEKYLVGEKFILPKHSQLMRKVY